MVDHEIRGDWSQTVLCRLNAGQEMYSEPERLVWKTPNVGVERRRPARGVSDASHGKGLLGRALSAGAHGGRRATSGHTVSLPHFRVIGEYGLCVFTGISPGEIRHIELNGSTWTVSRDAFVAAEGTVGLGLATSQEKAEGSGYARFAGPGSLFIAAFGEFVDVNPADHAGVIEANARAVVAFEDGVTLSVKDSEAGVPIATLRGDGKLILRG